jgi:hypothetical protein
MPVVGNRIKVASSSTGTGNITLGSAEDGYQTFAAGGISNNDVVRYVITEGSAWEIGKGTYLTSGPSLVRTSGNLLESSTGSLLDLGGSATVFVSLADVDVMQTDGGTFSGDVTFEGATTGRDIVFDRSANQLRFSDNAKVVFGDGTDATIHWNGSALEFSSELGDVLIRGNNEIKLQAHTGENFFVGLSNGASTLYYDNSAKLATTTTGVDVTGEVNADNYYVDQAGRIYFLDTSSAQKARIGLHQELRLYAGSTGTNSNAYMRFNGEGSTPIIEPSAAAGSTVGTSETIDFGGSSNRWKDIYGKNLDVSTNITVGGTVDGRDVATDGTKLDTIATNADVTPSWVPASDPSYLTAHPTITAASSVDNSGRTYIQDITLDANGHVTGITSATETVTNTDTTYSAGAGLDLSGTTFSLESDARGDLFYMGRDTNDYIGVETTHINFVLDGNVDARIENDGDFHADGNVIAYSTTISDPRLKENIKPVTNGLEKVMQLNGYTFDYKADGVSSAGVMSPEVAQVLPSAIKKSKLKLKMGDDNETEYDIVQYDQLTALLIEAIKDLKAEIEELKNASHK